jgi:tetratricopeptide (TPR) repeat protein
MSNKISRLITILLVMSSFFVAGQGKANEAVAWETYADTLVSQEKFADAIKLYDKIIDKSKLKTDEDYRVLYKRAYAYYGMHDFEKSLRDVNQYLERVPDQQAKLLRIYINQELGDHAAQLADLNEFIEQSPGNPELIRWRASILMDAGEYKKAQSDLRALLQQQPDPEIESFLGLTYYYQNNPDSALIVFDRVIAQQPSFIQPYLYAGSLCLEEGAYALSLQYINKGMKYEPANATLLFYKGAALVEIEGKQDEGCSCLRKAFNAGFDDAADYLKEYCYGAD